MGDHLYSEESAAAAYAAKEAGSIIMRLFKGKFDVHEKSKNNPVTSADLAANRKIREIILERFPKDGWLSEEDKDSAQRLSNSRVWVVDPIDQGIYRRRAPVRGFHRFRCGRLPQSGCCFQSRGGSILPSGGRTGRVSQ